MPFNAINEIKKQSNVVLCDVIQVIRREFILFYILIKQVNELCQK